MGECAEENPDLPYTLIKEILMGLGELDENEKTQALERKRRGT
jgi:hypothetical protein